ncbi:Stk1 family PASTA domain-containing Ser/Thr kinase [Actinomycetospora sp. TBRC 11914]|uniref:Stk1 family PASTA domain-containing Ser/Thr kinase n=1 Tax=Actinomycetospora sp. TBRC 11914 TaxID=2729387 RepID=UPI00145D75B4|nr:Stk1 family PASTA domain-containing Ser/Thr kinase [Actinomycetospora sp. TBRC 11914]NMO90184.1 Stk1 family PASTA domain-containing Ser/Thr kinase [Actinomycetospora sp. TBRC 11914]
MTTPRLLSDRYELGPALGYGGMSEVHGGRDVRLGRDVAIKVLRADLARDPQFQIRFQREAQNSAALNHPAIVAVYDTGETWADDIPLPYIVMEYVAGRTLRDIVKTGGPMDPARVCEVVADVCSALDFSHRYGIIHRDVKPANVMITPSGAVKVMDFGIARALSDAQPAVTQTAAVIGTAQYLSPEQARGEQVDARSDVYSTGCVLFELLTGQPPFTGDSPVAVAYQHVREDPRAPSELNPAVPPSLDAITLKALAKNPFNRYQTAGEMRDDLIRALQGEPVDAPLVMSDDERTDYMNQTGPTQAVGPAAYGGPATEAGDFAAWQAEQEDVRRSRRRRRNAIIGGVVLVAAVLAGLFWLTSPSNRQFAIPDVTNQPQDVALRTLTGAGLRPNLVQVASDPSQVGRVLGTDPAAGTQVQPDTVVALRVGRGPDRVQAPNLVGQTADQAQQMAQAAGLTLTPVPQNQQVDDQSQVGKVLSQNPSAGTPVAPGTAIQLTVGQARPTLRMPDVTGQDQATATQTLEGVGLNVTVTQVDGGGQPGTVVSTSPAAGSTVAQGSKVTLSVSKGNQLQVPSLIGKSRADALSALAAAGFSGNLQVNPTDVDDPNQDDKVLSQSPQAGSQAGAKDTITVNVGRYTGGGNGGGNGNGNGNGGVFGNGNGGLFPGN